MKPNLHLIVGAAAAAVIACSTLAQDAPIRRQVRTETVRTNDNRLQYSGHGDRYRDGDGIHSITNASVIIGMAVKNSQDEKIGKVEELAVDLASGRIVQVILSPSGIGNGLVAVPPRALRYDVVEKVARLDVDKEKLKSAPRFNSDKWDEYTQSNRVVEVYTYYGERAYFVASPEMTNEVRALGTNRIARTLPRNMDGTVNTDAGRSVDKARNVEAAQQLGDDYARTNLMADGTTNRSDVGGSAWTRLGRVEKASKLIGKPVKNLQNEKIGKVEDMLVDVGAGRVVLVLVSSGGFLGMGEELSPVPPAAFRVSESRDYRDSRDELELDISKDMLKTAPHYRAKDLPDYTQPSYRQNVYHTYKIESYDTDRARY